MPLPNVVVVVADDLGPHTIAPASPLRLPSLRALHDQSLVFENARASAVLCAPGRYALMTGNLPFRSRTGGGEWAWPAPSALKPGQRSVAQLLREGGGYHTQFAGKWHLGGDPIETGFDGAFFVPKGHSFSPYTTMVRGTGIRRPTEFCEYEGDAHHWSSATTRWRAALPGCLAAHARNVLLEAPMPFLYYHSASQKHGPFEEGVGLRQLETRANVSNFGPRFDAVVSFDLTVGVILQALNARGVAESTIVVLTSDHGQDCEWKDVKKGAKFCPPMRSTDGTHAFDFFGGVRGYKGLFFEGGLRVPLWVRWPGKVHAGVSTATTSNIDYVRTLLTMIGVQTPASQAVDSADLADEWLAAAPPERSRRNVFIANGPAQVAVRVADQKAIFGIRAHACRWNQTSPFATRCFALAALGDLQADPAERLDLPNLQADPAERLDPRNPLTPLSKSRAQCLLAVLLRAANSDESPTTADSCATGVF